MTDWETHLNTMFPEVRLKRTIEVRGGDSLPSNLACSVAALWTGLLYDERSFERAEDLVSSWTHDELEALRPDIAQRGLGATFRGAPLLAVAERVLDLAMAGLERRARLSRQGKDERSHLSRLAELVGAGKTPADALLEGLPDEPAEQRQAILERTRM
jgi:glutamate--cysteine ligase